MHTYASDVFSFSCHDVFYAFSLMQSIEHLTQQFEQMLVVMHSGLYLKHYRRFSLLMLVYQVRFFSAHSFFLFYNYYFFLKRKNNYNKTKDGMWILTSW